MYIKNKKNKKINKYIYIYIYMCVCVCVCVCRYLCIYGLTRCAERSNGAGPNVPF